MELWKEQRIAARVARDRRLSHLTEGLDLGDPTWLANCLAEYRGRLGGLLPDLGECELDYLALLLLSRQHDVGD